VETLNKPISTSSCGSRLRVGVAQFDRYDPLVDIGKLEKWGVDYSEPSVVKVMGLCDAKFKEISKKAAAGRIRVESMNSFIPADIKVVGPQVDHPRPPTISKRLWPVRISWERGW